MGCANFGKLTYLASLPKSLSENSGIVSIKDSTLWVIEDHGNKDDIYKIDLSGKIINHLKIKNAKNHDWEDLTKDEKGNLYIGDFGNNHNDRKNLVIYKLRNPELERGDKITAEKIEFSYPEQNNYPPKKTNLNFDAEAFFYKAGNLFIITKNRTIPFTGEAFIYKVPAKKGTYKAELIGKFITCVEGTTCQITAADLSPNGKNIALLGYGKVWIYSNFTGDDFSRGKLQTIDLNVRTQLESLCYLNNNTLLISDEVRKKTGGNLYTIKLKN